MSTTIDEKVVEMRFDNKNFESNVSETMSTLDKLKQSLNFDSAVNGFDTISKAAGSCDMSSLGSSVDSVQVKFSALQVVAVTALQNITNSAISAGEQLLSSLSVDNITAGWEKYSNKTTSVATLVAQGYDLETVEEQLERLNWYTDETSYNFTDMVSNIAKFTASGRDLEESVTAMEGIANWAALSGQNATTASSAMYQLSQAMSAGYMRLEDYKSIQNASMDTEEFRQKCLDAAVALGTLQENADGSYTSIVEGASSTTFTLSSFTTGLTEGCWLTSDVMMDVFNEYSNAVDQIYEYAEEHGITASEAIEELGDEVDEFGLKAFKAAQEARTWADVIDSVKDAVSTGWMNTFELIFGNYEEATALWTDLANALYDVFAEPINVFNEMLEVAMDNPFTDLIESIDSVTGATEAMTTAVTDYGSVVDDVLGGLYGNGQSRWDALTEAGYDWAYVQNLINEQLGDSTRHATDYAEAEEEVAEATSVTVAELLEMSDAELENRGFTEEVIAGLRELEEQSEKTGIPIEELAEDLDQLSGRSLLINGFYNIGESLLAIMNAIGEAWEEIFPSITSEQLYDAIAAFHKFTTYLEVNEETADKLTRTMKGLFAILDIITTITGGALKAALKIASKLIGALDVDVLDITASIGDAIVAFHDWLLEDSLLAQALDLVVDALADGITAVRDWIDEFKESEEVQTAIQGVQEWAEKLFETLASATEGVLPSVESVLATISSIISGLVFIIGQAIDKVKSWINAFLQIPEVQEAVTLLSEAISDIKQHFSDAITNFSTFLDHVSELDSISLDNIGEVFKMFKDDVLNDFLDIDDVFDNLKNGLTKLKDVVADKLTKIGNSLVGVKDKVAEVITYIQEALSGTNWGALLTVGVGAAIILLASKLSSALNGLSSPFEGINNLINTFTKTLKAAKLTMMAASLMMVAGAMLLMAGALALLSQAASADPTAFASAAAALILLAAAMAAMAAALAVISKNGNLWEAGASVLMIAGALLVLVGALTVIANLGDSVWSCMGVLGVLAAGLIAVVGVMTVLSKLTSGVSSVASSAGSAVALLGFAASLYILVGALEKLSNIDSLENAKEAMPLLLEMMAGLAVVSLAMGKLSIGSALGAIGIVVALKLLVGTLDDIANVDLDMITDNLASFILVFGTLSVLMLLSRVAGANAAKAGVMILAISASLLLIVAAIKLLEGVGSSALTRATIVIAGMMVVFGLLIGLSALAGANAAKAGVMLLAMSAAILILVGAIALLCLIDDPEGINRAVLTIGELMAMFAAVIAVTALAKDCKATLIILTVVIGMLAIALGALSTIPTENLTSATVALVAVMGAFAVMTAATTLAKGSTSTLLSLVAVVALLAVILGALTALDCAPSIETAASLSVLLLSLSAALVIIGQVKSVSTSALIAAGVLTLVVAGLATILGVLTALDCAPSIETAASLSILLLSLSAACLVLSMVPSTGATSGIVAMVEVVGALFLLVEAMGALVTYFPSIETFVDSGFELLSTFASGLGNCIGSFISGIGEGLTSGLPDIGTNLSDFWTNVEPFLTGVSGLDSSVTTGVNALVDALTSMMGAEILSAITSCLSFIIGGSDMSSFGSSLSAYIECLTDTNEALKDLDLDSSKFETAAAIGESMTTLANAIPKTGGILSKIVGEADIGDFGGRIHVFIAQLLKANEALVNADPALNATVMKSAAEVGEAMAALADVAPQTGGVFQDLLGESDIGDFGSRIHVFIAQLIKANEALVNADPALDAEAMKNAATVGEAMGEFADVVPQTGGSFQNWLGEKDIGDFGSRIRVYISHLIKANKALIEAGSSLDADAFNNAVTVGTAMSDLADVVPRTDGVFQYWLGKTDIAEFGEGIKTYVEAIVTAYQAMSGETISSSKFSTVSQAGIYMVEMAEALKDTDMPKSTKVDNYTYAITSTGEALGKFARATLNAGDGSNLAAITEQASELVTLMEEMNNLSGTDGVSSFVTGLSTLGDASVDGFVSAFTDSGTKVSSAVTGLMDTLVSSLSEQTSQIVAAFSTMVAAGEAAIRDEYSTLRAIGKVLIDTLAGGVMNRKSVLKQAFTDIVDAAKTAVRGYYSAFHSAGAYLVTGFANGISDNAYIAKAKAAAMASAANTAAENALDINSPSKKGYKTGSFFGQGFVNGIVAWIDASSASGAEMANVALESLSNTLSSLSSVIDQSMDSEPTIRPVLDLSNIESGAGRINSMLNNTPALAYSTSMAGQISASMREREIQNGSESRELLQAIRGLGKNLAGMGGNTYNTVNGLTYDDGSNVTDAVRSLIRAAKIERRI